MIFTCQDQRRSSPKGSPPNLTERKFDDWVRLMLDILDGRHKESGNHSPDVDFAKASAISAADKTGPDAGRTHKQLIVRSESAGRVVLTNL